MRRLSRYSRLIRDFEVEVDLYIKRRHGNRACARLRSDISRALARTVFTAKAHCKGVPKGKLCQALGALEKEIAADDYRLPRAWFETCIYGATRRTVNRRWKVKSPDIDTLE